MQKLKQERLDKLKRIAQQSNQELTYNNMTEEEKQFFVDHDINIASARKYLEDSGLPEPKMDARIPDIEVNEEDKLTIVQDINTIEPRE